MTRKSRIVMLSVVAAFSATGLIALAGDLNPPVGPITATMKTLTEVEPRTPIKASDLPLTISQSGAYYLTGNVSTAGNGITITVDNVTLDLMGFTLAGGTGHGIAAVPPRKNVVVCNGVVSGWAGSGVTLGLQCEVRNVRAESCSLNGIALGNDSAVYDCTAKSCDIGIAMSIGCRAQRCLALSNLNLGLSSTSQGFFIECIADSNTNDGFNTPGCRVVDCVARFNGRDGIVSPAALVTGCLSTFNGRDGIRVNGQSAVIVGNHCDRNGFTSDGAGIQLTPAAIQCRIEANSVVENDRGLDVDSTNCLILRNSARFNTTNYDIAANNRYGPIINLTPAGTPAAVGNSAASTVATTDPWANFAY